MDPTFQTATAEQINASLRFYMMLLMHKLAPPEGVRLTMEEIEAFKVDPRNHLLIQKEGDVVTAKMVIEGDIPLLYQATKGNA